MGEGRSEGGGSTGLRVTLPSMHMRTHLVHPASLSCPAFLYPASPPFCFSPLRPSPPCLSMGACRNRTALPSTSLSIALSSRARALSLPPPPTCHNVVSVSLSFCLRPPPRCLSPPHPAPSHRLCVAVHRQWCGRSTTTRWCMSTTRSTPSATSRSSSPSSARRTSSGSNRYNE